MSYHGQCNWPPRWTQRQGSLLKPVQGEVGVLKYVYSNHGSDSCYLVIEYEKESYIACLMFDNAVFAGKVVALLRSNVGRPVKEIGDLELPDGI